MEHFTPEQADKQFTEVWWPQASGLVFKLLLQQRGSADVSRGWETRQGARTALQTLQNPSEEAKLYMADITAAKERGADIHRFVHIKERSLWQPSSVGYFRHVLELYGRRFIRNEQVHVFSDAQTQEWGIEMPAADYTTFDGKDTVHIRTYLSPETHEITHREEFRSTNSSDSEAIEEAIALRSRLFEHVEEMPLVTAPEDGQFCFDAVAKQLGLAIPVV